jgi:hypothetical protein
VSLLLGGEIFGLEGYWSLVINITIASPKLAPLQTINGRLVHPLLAGSAAIGTPLIPDLQNGKQVGVNKPHT